MMKKALVRAIGLTVLLLPRFALPQTSDNSRGPEMGMGPALESIEPSVATPNSARGLELPPSIIRKDALPNLLLQFELKTESNLSPNSVLPFWEDVKNAALSGAIGAEDVRKAAQRMRAVRSSIPAIRFRAEGAAGAAEQIAAGLESLGPGERLTLANIPGIHITARERQVLDGLADGLSNKEIAKDLDIARRTVKGHVRHLLPRFQAKSRTTLGLLWSQTLPPPGPTPHVRPSYIPVVHGIIQGKKNRAIAVEVGTTEQVIKNYARDLFDIFGVDTRQELALRAVRYSKFADAGPRLKHHINVDVFDRRLKAVDGSEIPKLFKGVNPRRDQVFRELLQGKDNPEIADTLGVSLYTVKYYVTAITAAFKTNSVLVAMQRVADVPGLRHLISRSPSGAKIPRLTPREQALFDYVLSGMDNKEIAARKGLKALTVKRQCQGLQRRFGVRTRRQLVARVVAIRNTERQRKQKRNSEER